MLSEARYKAGIDGFLATLDSQRSYYSTQQIVVQTKLTAAQTDEVKKYRAEGEALHKAGKHQESLDTLAKAEKILDIPTK